MNPSRVDEEAKEASGNVPGVVAAVVGVGLLGAGFGYATSQKVPEGKVGVVPKSDWYETNPTRVLPPGMYFFAGLRFPNLSIITPGATTTKSLLTELTPGLLDKVKASAQKSLVLNSIERTREALKQAQTHHLRVESRLEYTIPSEGQLQDFIAKVGDANFEKVIARSCERALQEREDRLNSKRLTPEKVAAVGKEVAETIEKMYGLKGVGFTIDKIERVSRGHTDYAAERDKRRKTIEEVAEVLFTLTLGR